MRYMMGFVLTRLHVPRRGKMHQPPATYLPSAHKVDSIEQFLSAPYVTACSPHGAAWDPTESRWAHLSSMPPQAGAR